MNIRYRIVVSSNRATLLLRLYRHVERGGPESTTGSVRIIENSVFAALSKSGVDHSDADLVEPLIREGTLRLLADQSHCRCPSLFVIRLSQSQLAKSSCVLIGFCLLSVHVQRNELPSLAHAVHERLYEPCGRRRCAQTSSPKTFVMSLTQSRT